jgi:hypothetical protein
MKYIVLDTGERELPIIFPDEMNHIDIATAITNLGDYKSCRLVAGGFIQMGSSLCFGSSQTLAISSRIEDQALINGYDYSHGIKDQIDIVTEIMDSFKTNVAVVCENKSQWDAWQPGLAVVGRSTMRLETEHCIYWGILHKDQSTGVRFDHMVVLGNPSIGLIKSVNSRMNSNIKA